MNRLNHIGRRAIVRYTSNQRIASCHVPPFPSLPKCARPMLIPFLCVSLSVCSPAYSEIDPDIVHELRAWSHSQLESRLGGSGAGGGVASVGVGAGVSSSFGPLRDRYTRTISQLESNGFFDIICTIVFVDPSGGQQFEQTSKSTVGGHVVGGGGVGQAIAYIWDGTDLQTNVRFQRRLLMSGIELPSPSSSSSHHRLLTPRFGSIIPVSYFLTNQPQFEELFTRSVSSSSYAITSPPGTIPPPPPPCFVHLRNLPFECDANGEFTLKCTTLSKVIPLRSDDPRVLSMMDRYMKRQDEERKRARIQAWSSVHPVPIATSSSSSSSSSTGVGMAFTPLKLLSSPSDTPSIGKFRVRARIIGTIPRFDIGLEDSNETSAAASSSASSSNAGDPPMRVEQISKVECRSCNRWQPATPPQQTTTMQQQQHHPQQPSSHTPNVPSSNVVDRCHECGQIEQLSYGYFLKLILQDATGMLPVLLCGKEAVRMKWESVHTHIPIQACTSQSQLFIVFIVCCVCLFPRQDDLFHGLPADNLYSSQTTLKFVRQRLQRLMEPGSYIDCHLQGYEVDTNVASYSSSSFGSQEEDEFGGGGGSGSQMICSQDLETFFQPQLLPSTQQDEDDDEQNGRDDQQQRSSSTKRKKKMIRVHRIVDVAWRAV